MVGIPIFAGFVSKLLFAEAAVLVPNWQLLPTLIVLAISTILNAIYFLKTVLRIYSTANPGLAEEKGFRRLHFRDQKLFAMTMVLFIFVNIVLGSASQPLLRLIEQGLHHFA